MSTFRIICARRGAGEKNHGEHIVAVGTGLKDGEHDILWSIDEIIAAMEKGHVFYTMTERTGRKAGVEKFTCSSCRRDFIRSGAEAGPDNSLEKLPHCE